MPPYHPLSYFSSLPPRLCVKFAPIHFSGAPLSPFSFLFLLYHVSPTPSVSSLYLNQKQTHVHIFIPPPCMRSQPISHDTVFSSFFYYFSNATLKKQFSHVQNIQMLLPSRIYIYIRSDKHDISADNNLIATITLIKTPATQRINGHLYSL